MRIVIGLLSIMVALMVYVRLAPTDPDQWHVAPPADIRTDVLDPGGLIAVRDITAPAPEVLAALEQRILATPRTSLIAGSVAEGMITFRTRSLIWGFPDFTTVLVRDGKLMIHGRLRFGRSDMGVNQARIEGWLASLGPLTRPL